MSRFLLRGLFAVTNSDTVEPLWSGSYALTPEKVKALFAAPVTPDFSKSSKRGTCAS